MQTASSEPPPESGLPLSGVTVADFSWVLAGPRCTSWLGAMGARVIKIEGPKRPDQYRRMAIYGPLDNGLEGSGAFHNLNHTKVDIALDFTHPRGLDLAKRIVALSDVVVENFAYGVMDRAGLGYEVLAALKPGVVMLSGSAMGKTGPDKAHVAYGTLIHAFTGINSVTGYPGELQVVGSTYSDPLTGTTMVLAVLAALWHSRRTGQGQHIDMSMVEATLMQLPEFVLDYTANGRVAGPQGNDVGEAAPCDTYPCAGENAWVAIQVETQAEWDAFCGVLGDPAWTKDERFRSRRGRFEHRDAMYDHVAAWTRTQTPMQAAETLQEAGVAAGPSYNAAELHGDEHFNQRGLFLDLEHPVVGTKSIFTMPWRIEPGLSERYWVAPTLGQHTGHVLRDILGLDAAEIASLRAEGVIL